MKVNVPFLFRSKCAREQLRVAIVENILFSVYQSLDTKRCLVEKGRGKVIRRDFFLSLLREKTFFFVTREIKTNKNAR